MRLLSTLYVTDHRARIGVQSRSLLVTMGNGVGRRVPVEAVDAVVIVGHAQITTDALALCAGHGVRVSSLTGGGRVRFAVQRGMSGNVQLRKRQYRMAEDNAATLALARVLVAGKLVNSRSAVQRWSWDASIRTRRAVKAVVERLTNSIEAIWEAPTPDHARGVEGDGARAYFEALRYHLSDRRPDLTFNERSRRPPRDAVNAVMSFSYALLLGTIEGATEGVGLDPQVGFLHAVRPGRPALALDLLEEFRPALADRFAVGLLARRMLGDEDFTTTPGGGWYLSDAGRQLFLELWEAHMSEDTPHELLGRSVTRAALPVVQATIMARHLRGDLPTYAPYARAG